MKLRKKKRLYDIEIEKGKKEFMKLRNKKDFIKLRKKSLLHNETKNDFEKILKGFLEKLKNQEIEKYVLQTLAEVSERKNIKERKKN